jgi:DNA gyrase inhibitor GyrI
MNEEQVRIVKLEPRRAVRFHGFGSSPESAAWEKLEAWAKPRGLLDWSEEHRVFGFDNPIPSPGSPNYGYEFWLTVDPAEVEGEEVEVTELPGGGHRYAVMRCEVKGDDPDVIPAAWKRLVAWHEASPYREARHQWLEEHISVDEPGEDFVLDLYLPIAE